LGRTNVGENFWWKGSLEEVNPSSRQKGTSISKLRGI